MGRLSLVLALSLAGCGAVANGNSGSSDAGDAGTDATSQGSDGGAPEASRPVGDASLPEQARCDGGAITAPAGGACDSSRLVIAARGGGGCFGVGQFCDTLRLDGACAATVALPNVRVDCIIYD